MENSSHGEEYPLDEYNNTLYADGKWIPDETPNLTRTDEGGCFGDGPGPINYTAGQLTLPSYKFFKKGALYEIMLEVRKDVTRVAYAYIQIEIVKGTPPLMQISCGDPALCRKDEKGQVYITLELMIMTHCPANLPAFSCCLQVHFCGPIMTR